MSALGEAWRGFFGGSKQKAGSQTYINPTQAAELDKLYGAAGGLYEDYAQDPTALVAGTSPYTRWGDLLATGAAANIPTGELFGAQSDILSGRPYSFASDLAPRVSETISRRLTPGGTPAYTTPAPNIPRETLARMMSGQVNLDPYNQVYDAASGRMTRAFTEDVLPAIRRENVGSAGFGSTRRDIATGIASDRLQQNLADLAANIYGGAYETAQGQVAPGAQLATQAALAEPGLLLDASRLSEGARQFDVGQELAAAGLFSDVTGADVQARLAALGLSPTLAETSLIPANIYQAIGEREQRQQQAELEAPFSLAQRYQSLLGTPTTLSTASSTGKSNTGKASEYYSNMAMGMGMGG